MARKLRLVGSDPLDTVTYRVPLRAKQIITSTLSDGSQALLMLSEEGRIYILGTEGWLAYPMMEVPHNDSTV